MIERRFASNLQYSVAFYNPSERCCRDAYCILRIVVGDTLGYYDTVVARLHDGDTLFCAVLSLVCSPGLWHSFGPSAGAHS